MNDLTKTEEMLLICILRLKDEAYGYAIRKYITQLIGKDFTYGNLYSALSQLVKKSYVSKKTGSHDSQNKGKLKIYYAVSPSGINALKASREVHDILWDGINDYVFNNK